MPLSQTMTEEEQVTEDEATLGEEEEADLRIAVNMAKTLIDEGGIEVIDSAEESSDPAQVIGQFLFQMVSQMGENLPADVELSPRIFFAEGGWIEQISDYIQEQYGVDKKVMDKAEIYIGTAAEEMAKGQQAGAQQPQQAAAPAAPMMPQGAV